MAIKAIYETEADVPVFLKDHVRKLDNGKFVVDLEKMNEVPVYLENVPGLISAVEKMKQERKTDRDKLATFGDLDPTEARSAMSKLAMMGNADQKTDERIAAAREEISKSYEDKILGLSKTNETLNAQLANTLVSRSAAEAIQKVGGKAKLLLPHVEAAIFLEKDDAGQLVQRIKGPNGIARSSAKNPAEFMSVDEFVDGLKADDDFSFAFPTSVNRGTGSGEGKADGSGVSGNPYAKGSENFTEQMRLMKENPELAKDLQAKATEAAATT